MEKESFTVLIADKDIKSSESTKNHLIKSGYHVKTVHSGKEAIEAATKEMPSLILLDIPLQDIDGIEVCRELRENPSLVNTVIAFLTERKEDYAQIAAFDAGADDYIIKPVNPVVLAKKVKSLLKTPVNEKAKNKHIMGDLEMDVEKFLVLKGKTPIDLTKREFELLALFMSRPGKVFSKKEIFEKVWGREIIVADKTIDVYIKKLREKIGRDYFKTVRGVGIKLLAKNASK